MCVCVVQVAQKVVVWCRLGVGGGCLVSCGVVCDAHFLRVLVFGGVVVSLVVLVCSCRVGSFLGCLWWCWVRWCRVLGVVGSVCVSFWVCVCLWVFGGVFGCVCGGRAVCGRFWVCGVVFGCWVCVGYGVQDKKRSTVASIFEKTTSVLNEEKTHH